MSNLEALWSSVDKSIKNRVVLVADSHPYFRSITRTILLQLGVKATQEASDGFQAIEAICAFDPCVMILDLNIRGMDAREVVRVIRTSGVVPDPQMPIIAISDPMKRSRVVEAKQLGINHILIRPISPMLVQQRLFPVFMRLIRPAPSADEASDSLLTAKDAAEVLKVAPSWLAKARKSNEGPPYVRVGRSVRYRPADLTRWAKSNGASRSGRNDASVRASQRG
ncbi:response regulator [Bradyrhizobium sp.]|uniref:response regulator n=1 Tax=Bradyrhizobium sp. TaxID=376 RepID=UPI0025C40AEA|nr:response regulator [Bradyrhizobium sp.]